MTEVEDERIVLLSNNWPQRHHPDEEEGISQMGMTNRRTVPLDIRWDGHAPVQSSSESSHGSRTRGQYSPPDQDGDSVAGGSQRSTRSSRSRRSRRNKRSVEEEPKATGAGSLVNGLIMGMALLGAMYMLFTSMSTFVQTSLSVPKSELVSANHLPVATISASLVELPSSNSLQDADITTSQTSHEDHDQGEQEQVQQEENQNQQNPDQKQDQDQISREHYEQHQEHHDHDSFEHHQHSHPYKHVNEHSETVYTTFASANPQDEQDNIYWKELEAKREKEHQEKLAQHESEYQDKLSQLQKEQQEELSQLQKLVNQEKLSQMQKDDHEQAIAQIQHEEQHRAYQHEEQDVQEKLVQEYPNQEHTNQEQSYKEQQDSEYNNQEQMYQGQSHQDKSYKEQNVPEHPNEEYPNQEHLHEHSFNQDHTNQQPIQEYTNQENRSGEHPTQEEVLNYGSHSEDHTHIKIGDLAAFMEKGGIVDLDNGDAGHSSGESTSQLQAYGGHPNHDLENTKSTSTINNSSPQFFNEESQNPEQFESTMQHHQDSYSSQYKEYFYVTPKNAVAFIDQSKILAEEQKFYEQQQEKQKQGELQDEHDPSYEEKQENYEQPNHEQLDQQQQPHLQSVVEYQKYAQTPYSLSEESQDSQETNNQGSDSISASTEMIPQQALMQPLSIEHHVQHVQPLVQETNEQEQQNHQQQQQQQQQEQLEQAHQQQELSQELSQELPQEPYTGAPQESRQYDDAQVAMVNGPLLPDILKVFQHVRNVAEVPEEVGDIDKEGDVIFVWHVPKSAGATLIEVLDLCYGRIQAEQIHEPASKELVLNSEGRQRVNVSTNTTSSIRLAKHELHLLDDPSTVHTQTIASAHIFQAATLFTPYHRGRMITLLRHPVQRAMSAFHYFQSKSSKPMTLLEYASGGTPQHKSHLVDNWLVRHLTATPNGPLALEHVERATQFLRQKCLIGFSDYRDKGVFAKTLKRFHQYLKLTMIRPGCIEHHVTRPPKNHHEHPVDFNVLSEGSPEWNALATLNQYDLLLYRNAEQIYREQGRLLGDED